VKNVINGSSADKSGQIEANDQIVEVHEMRMIYWEDLIAFL